MPKVCLTEAQRQEAALIRQYQKLSDGLAAFMNREKLTKAQTANAIRIGYKSFIKLLCTEEVSVNVVGLLRILQIAGYKIVPIKKEEEE